MNNSMRMILGIVAVSGSMALMGCGPQTPPPGPAEKAGAAVDKAATKAVDKTGEGLEKAGAAVEKAGENLQK